MLTLQVHPKDGDPWVVETNLFTIVAWERKYKRPASVFGSEMALEWLAFLAFEAAKQSGITVPAVFDDFLRRIVKVEVLDRDVDPTDPVPTAGS